MTDDVAPRRHDDPDALRGNGAIGTAEEAALRRRRTAAGLPVPGESAEGDWLGVGLSGGGIRSATFCLGFFQALARERLVRHVDLLSTVSGGGYFGGFLGRLFRREHIGGVDDVEAVLRAEKEPDVLHHLRENGRYLAPGGSGDVWIAIATILRGWVAVVVMLGLLLLLPFLALHWIRIGITWFDPTGVESGLRSIGLSGSGGVWWSPWMVLPLLVIVFGAFPLGSAYWLADSSRKTKVLHLVLVAAIGAAVAVFSARFRVLGAGFFLAAVVTMLLAPQRELRTETGLSELRNRRTRGLARVLQWVAGALALAAIDTIAGSLYRSAAGGAFWGRLAAVVGASSGVLAAYGDRVAALLKPVAGRVRLSVPRAVVFTAAGIGLSLALLVGVGIASHGLSAGFDVPADRAPERAAAAGFGVASVVPSDVLVARDLRWTTAALAACMLLSWIASLATPFLNRSSHHAFYSGRLVKAYLGASNRKRLRGGLALREHDPDDDMDIGAYYTSSGARGAPIHLLNLTVNETVDGASNVQQQDRRGMILSLAPDGLHVGRGRSISMDWGNGTAVRDGGPRTGEEVLRGARPEDLSLGQWTALSGAAFSTGLGSRTQLGTSLLCGIGNIRLGYWWASGVPPDATLPDFWAWSMERIRWVWAQAASSIARAMRAVSSGVSSLSARRRGGLARSFSPGEGPAPEPSTLLTPIPGLGSGRRPLAVLRDFFGVHAYLLSEFVARFPGTSWPRWYLSDGGHFENLGGYELIRRRLTRIVLVDAEADPTYVFEGLSNLVRKARMDFGAEIRFRTDGELDAELAPEIRPFFGSLATIRSRRSREPDATGGLGRTSCARAALAEVHYEGGLTGRLLYVKATVTGDEPIDLVGYAMAHPEFPHESTADQFFDEAQWESYRRLGEHIGSLLFAEGEAAPTAQFTPRAFVQEAVLPTPPPAALDRRATMGTKSA